MRTVDRICVLHSRGHSRFLRERVNVKAQRRALARPLGRLVGFLPVQERRLGTGNIDPKFRKQKMEREGHPKGNAEGF